MWLYFLIALMGGMVLPMQAGLNSVLAKPVGGSYVASLLSFGVGTATLILFTICMRLPLPSWQNMTSAPWWAWLGGVCGAFFVAVVTISAPKLGAITLVAVVIIGQMLASVMLDHYGLMGFSQSSLTMTKALGCVLLLAGVMLIQIN